MKNWIAIIMLMLCLGFASMAQSDPVFTISPNPVESGDVTLSINYPGTDIKGIRIFDIIGKEVAFIDLNGKSGATQISIDISTFRPGIYFCNLYSDKGIIESRKLIKNK